MSTSRLLWIDRDDVAAWLDAASRQPMTPPRNAPHVAPGRPAVEDAAAPSQPATTPRGAALGELPGVSAEDVARLADPDFDRVGPQLLERLRAEPGVVDAFIADGDGLVLFGDEEETPTLAVIAAELAGRWLALQSQLELEAEPALVTVRLAEGRHLSALAVATAGGYQRILAWIGA